MIEHWYEYLPAAWLTPEARWYVLFSVLLLIAIAFGLGCMFGYKLAKKK